ncbi:hypothetical protein EDC25_1197 [Pseudofulvimonas gallinarii]|uniref:Uncharacterized protein n=1 Tax=Pseudofulvimonas gallinarii TaxID=634155 RepID=A0A4R3L7W0_9GAMM|nr:hypothetical protein EDC25_1197 [Pseudofulvimonas gallinarii]
MPMPRPDAGMHGADIVTAAARGCPRHGQAAGAGYWSPKRAR